MAGMAGSGGSYGDTPHVVESLDDFFHGTLSQHEAHGLIVDACGGPEGLRGRVGTFLVWEGKKGVRALTLSLVTKRGEIEDNIITRDDDGEFRMNSEETGHDDLLTFVQAFQTALGLRQMRLDMWMGRPILQYPVPKETGKKEFKRRLGESKRAFKSYRQSVKMRRKAVKKASMRGGTPVVEQDTEYDVDTAPKSGASASPAGTTPVHHWDRQQAVAELKRLGCRDGDFVVRWLDKVKSGYIVTSICKGVVTYSSLSFLAGQIMYGPEAIGATIDEAIDTLINRKKVISSGALFGVPPYHLVRYDDQRKTAVTEAEAAEGRERSKQLEQTEQAKAALEAMNQRGWQPPKHSTSHVLGYSEDASRDVEMRRVSNIPKVPLVNEQARGAPELIGQRTAVDDKDREIQRVANIPKVALVNEQARGAPELIGQRTAVDSQDAEIQRVANIPKVALVNEQARGAPELIGQRTQVDSQDREIQRVANHPKVPLVNEQARGAPELIGQRTAVDSQDAEIQRVKALGGKAMRAPQARVNGALERDKQAHASWAMGHGALADGERHEYEEMARTLQFDKREDATAEPVAGFHDDFSPFFFPVMTAKRDAETLLQLVGEEGAFLMRPDPALGNTKYVLSFRHGTKVTHHLLFRDRPGEPFGLCCMPFSMENAWLSCTTLLDVVKHLMTSRPYWPHPLAVGVPCPADESEYSDMVKQMEAYRAERAASRAMRVAQSLGRNAALGPQLHNHAMPAGPSGGRRDRKAASVKVAKKAPADGDSEPVYKVQYTVAITSGDRVTTCAHTIVLHGLVGLSEPLPLRGKRPVFQSGTEREFLFELADVGPVSQITLRHDGVPSYPGGEVEWDVKRVDVDRFDDGAKGKARHNRTHFKCEDRPLGPSGSLGQTFEAESDKEIRKLKEAWKLRVDAHHRRMAEASALARDTHLAKTNVLLPGADMIHQYDETALEVKRQRAAGDLTADVRVDKGVSRGAIEAHKVDSSATHIKLATDAPRPANYNPQGITGDFSRDKKADASHGDEGYAVEDTDAVIAQAKGHADRGNAFRTPSSVRAAQR